MLGPPLRSAPTGTELTMVLPASAVLAAAGKGPPREGETQAQRPSSSRTASLSAQHAVVAVEAGPSWASGVLVSTAGHVLTNAHALPGGTPPLAAQLPDRAGLQEHATAAEVHAVPRRPPVRVLVAGGAGSGALPSWHTADVVHVFAAPLDLAVLKIRGDGAGFSPAVLSAAAPLPGSPVVVAGFPLWRPQRGGALGGAILTSGNVAKLLPSSGEAVLLTSAAVVSGASGGAVIDPANGTLVGLVTSNTRLVRPQRTQGQPTSSHPEIYPSLNYSIPAAVLRPVVEAAQRAGQGSAAVDWAALEAGFERAGVLRAWKGVHSMAAEEVPPGEGARVPPRLAALLDGLPPRGREGAPKAKL